jgi:putative radical SAM enzyme (TIGR03279 family)
MYFKDDDVRLSFLEGNYVTLTNLSDDDVERICSLKISPVNVSVHTTNADLRCKMLNNRFAGRLIPIMKRFAEAGITMNAQIVLCKGINDGEELKQSLLDLSELYPHIRSVSVVPVGLTAYREGLYPLSSFEKEDCIAVIDEVTAISEEFLSKYGTRLVYLSDEFYINAGLSFPKHEFYDGFPQLENGVGMCSLLKQEVSKYLADNGENLSFYLNKKLSGKKFVHIATGRAAYGIIKELADEVSLLSDKLQVTVHPIRNDFFGETVTVSGLTTGQDIEAQLKGKLEDDAVLLLPVNMLRAGEETFLDNYTVSGLEESLKVDISIVEEPGRDFVRKIVSAGGKIDLSDFTEKGDLI